MFGEQVRHIQARIHASLLQKGCRVHGLAFVLDGHQQKRRLSAGENQEVRGPRGGYSDCCRCWYLDQCSGSLIPFILFGIWDSLYLCIKDTFLFLG